MNAAILAQAHSHIGMTAIEHVMRSIMEYAAKNPDDPRYPALFDAARSLCDADCSGYNRILRENSRIASVRIPSEYLHLLSPPIDTGSVQDLISREDCGSLSAIAVFIRYGMLDLSPEPIESFFRGVPKKVLKHGIRMYNDRADSEFRKMQSFTFLEAASERGDRRSTDRLRRYHGLGRHTVKDPERSDFYLRRGCRQGDNDCLIAYCKGIGRDPDFAEKVGKYRWQFDNASVSVWMVLSDLYLENGDEEKSMEYLVKAARRRFGPAVSRWLDILMEQDPYDMYSIDRIEGIIVGGKLDACWKLAQFYHDNRDAMPDRLPRLIERLGKAGCVCTWQIRDRYCGSIAAPPLPAWTPPPAPPVPGSSRKTCR